MNTHEEHTPDLQTAPDSSETSMPDDGGDESARLVPVAEAIRYRKRAQAAEQKVADLTQRIGEAEHELTETQQRLGNIETRTEIDHLLREAGSIDLEAARLLTLAAMDHSDDAHADRDPATVIEELRTKRPYLFRPAPDDPPNGTAKSAAVRANRGAPARRAEAAAAEARRTGRRDDLTRYLQVRRATRSVS